MKKLSGKNLFVKEKYVFVFLRDYYLLSILGIRLNCVRLTKAGDEYLFWYMCVLYILLVFS